MLQQRRMAARGLILTFMASAIVLPACTYVVLSRLNAPSGLFRQYVLDPIPTSVSEIEVDHYRMRLRYAYIFQFNIDKSDLDRLARSRPFAEARIVDWKPGFLYWAWKEQLLGGMVMSVYPPRQRKPSWFTAEMWEDPKVYAMRKEGSDANTQVLLYDLELQQACFIICSED